MVVYDHDKCHAISFGEDPRSDTLNVMFIQKLRLIHFEADFMALLCFFSFILQTFAKSVMRYMCLLKLESLHWK